MSKKSTTAVMNVSEHSSSKNVLSNYKWLFFWMAVAAAACVVIYFTLGADKAVEFAGGYLIEFSLSIDNVFVFLMIFMGFGISEHAQHRVLRYGILGAIVLRFIFVFFGVAVISRFEWLLYIFGALLIYNGAKMFKNKDNEEQKDPHDSRIVRVLKKIMPMTDRFYGEKFFVKENAKRLATPLFAVLVVIETSDIIFAIDSVPAVISVSKDVLIVYLSNICALLGLRQLFFVVEHMQSRFEYVRYGVAVILIFTGLKMVLGIFHIEVSTPVSILVIVCVLAASILLSVLISRGRERKDATAPVNENIE